MVASVLVGLFLASPGCDESKPPLGSHHRGDVQGDSGLVLPDIGLSGGRGGGDSGSQPNDGNIVAGTRNGRDAGLVDATAPDGGRSNPSPSCYRIEGNDGGHPSVATCPAVGAFWVNPPDTPAIVSQPFTIFLQQFDDACQAWVAYDFFDPELFNVELGGDGVRLRPTCGAPYWEFKDSWATHHVGGLVDVVLQLDGDNPIQTSHVEYDMAYNMDWWSDRYASHGGSVEALSTNLRLRADLPIDRGFLPWDPVRISVSPPVADITTLTISSSAYEPWQPVALSPSSGPLGEYVEPPPFRDPLILAHSSVTARPKRWTLDGAVAGDPLLVEAAQLQDMSGRPLDFASLSVPMDALPEALTSHDFDGEVTFRLYVDSEAAAAHQQPAECLASGCITLSSSASQDAQAAGLVVTEGAGTLRLDCNGDGFVQVFDAAGQVLFSGDISSTSGAPPETWGVVEIPLLGEPYVGVVLGSRIDFDPPSAPLFVNRIWAE